MDNIITKLYGGLGNQMFQYAAGRALSLRNNSALKLDLSWFANVCRNITRPFLLRVFDIDIVEASPEEISKFVPSMLRKILRFYNHKTYIKENQFSFNKNTLNLNGNFYLDGYWQSEKYFKDFENIIRKDFTLKNIGNETQRISNTIKNTKNSLSIHIRRGDYIKNPRVNNYHGVCSMEYYKDAIGCVKNKVGDVGLFIFSDDIEWAKEQELFSGATFISSTKIKDYEEMFLMSLCKHNIIANSSFSWWGAWLNNNPNKIIIAPQKWFNVSKDTSDLIPENWIRM